MKRLKFKEWLSENHSLSVEELGQKGNATIAQHNSAYMDYTAEWLEGARKSETSDQSEILKAVQDEQEATRRANAANQQMLVQTQEALKTQGLAMQRMIDRGEAPADAKKAVLDKFNAFKSEVEENKKKGKQQWSRMTITKAELAYLKKEIAQKATFVQGSITDNTAGFRIQEIDQLAHRRLTMYDLFTKIPVGEDTDGNIIYDDWDELTTVRAAAAMLENTPFPESTATFRQYVEPMEKIGDSISMTYESTIDRARYVAEIEQFIRDNVDLEIDAQLYDGNGVSPNLTGVYTSAQLYVPVAIGLQDPNIFDLLRKVRTSISRGKRSKFLPNIAVMNVEDIDNMILKKDGENNYVRPDFFQMRMEDGMNVYVVSGMLIVESNVVDPNTMLVGDLRRGAIYEQGGYMMEMGYKTGDWENDRVSIKLRKRLMMLIKELNKPAWRKVESISAALTTLGS